MPDLARVEYGPIDLTTYEAVADAINGAAPTDRFDILVNTGPSETPLELFEGPVVSWQLEERYGDDGKGGVIKETVGVLEGLDARGVTLQTRLDQHILFQGVSYPRPSVGVPPSTRVVNSTLRTVIEYLAGQAGFGVNVPDAANYTLSSPMLTTGSTIGQMMAQLLLPLQQVRSRRVDFVRTGNVYTLQQRPDPLPSPDHVIPWDQVELRGWRRTRPRPAPVKPTDVELATEFIGGASGRTAESPLDTWGFRSELIVLPDGTIENSYQDGRLTRQVVDRTVNGVTERTEINVYSPSSFMEGHDSEQFRAGLRIRVITHRIFRNSLGAIVAERTYIIGRDPFETPLPALTFQSSTVITKSRVGSGTLKTTVRSRVNPSGTVIVEAPVHEFSPGDTHAVDDAFGNSPFGPPRTSAHSPVARENGRHRSSNDKRLSSAIAHQSARVIVWTLMPAPSHTRVPSRRARLQAPARRPTMLLHHPTARCRPHAQDPRPTSRDTTAG